MIHWSSVSVALVAGLWTAAQEPAEPLLEQFTRALGIAGPGVQLLVIAYWTAEVFVALMLGYVLASLALRSLSSRLR